MTEQIANNASTTLNGAITNVATTLIVTSAAAFPTAGTFRLLIESEYMTVTSVTGTTFTVTRGAESSTAAAHASGVAVVAVLTSAAFAQIKTDSKTLSAGATAGQVQTGDGAGGFTAPANVLAGAGYVSVGASPAASGMLRVPNNVDVITSKTVGGVDVGLLGHSSGNALYVGAANAGATHVDNLYLYPNTGGQLLTTGAGVILDWSGTNLSSAVPIVGFSQPWGVHGKIADATVGAFTVTAATYNYDAIQLTGGTAATVTFPSATDAAAYYKTIINTSGVTKTLSNGGATTVAITTGNVGRYLFDAAGVHLVGATTAWV